jgi:hypothetical protein
VLQQALSDLPAASLDRLHEQLERLIKVMKVKSLEARTMLISEM